MKLIHIVGARPNFIKLAPVYRIARGTFEQIVIHTGQHYDHSMSQIFFDELSLPEPDINLGVKEKTHGKQTARMLEKLEDGLMNYNPKEAIVVVYGDTNSTLAGALAAKKLKFHIAHVEAYTRSWDWDMPEEINRNIVDCIANLNFTPRLSSNKNESFITRNVGDVTYDQFLWVQDRLDLIKAQEDSPLDYNEYVLVTIHREENTEPERFEEIQTALMNTGKMLFWPRHPRIGDPSPISYLKMLAKIRDAQCVITDSGGIQKEAFWFKTPCITVRNSTEWPETVKSGWNVLVEPDGILEAIEKKTVRQDVPNPYGDGHAAERIVTILKERYKCI